MSMTEPSGDRSYQDFLQQVTALVRQSRVAFKALEVPYWLSYFLSSKVRHCRTFSDGSIAEGLRRELSQVWQMEDDRE